jgi:hypothetical protein
MPQKVKPIYKEQQLSLGAGFSFSCKRQFIHLNRNLALKVF